MPDISKITLPSGSTYDIKDATAREQIESIQTSITSAMSYVGVTTTALTDGASTSPIVINSSNHTASAGDVAIYGDKEFVFNGTVWNEFGDMGSLKALAFKDTASATYTPAGSVSQPTFTGTAETVSVSGTPEGTVSQPTFSGTQATITVSGTPTGSVTISKGTGTANYTPEGSISTPTITVTPSTTTVNSITAVGTLPAWTGTVSNENLTIAWSAGTLPTKGSDTTVATGIQSATSTQPTFTGTGAELKGSFTGTSFNSTGSYTPAGSVSQPTFTGETLTSEGSFTPAGTVSKPSFTGTQATITVS